jgi:hypothetical protein
MVYIFISEDFMYKSAKVLPPSTTGTIQAQALTILTSGGVGGCTFIGFSDGATFNFATPTNSVVNLDVAVRGAYSIGANTTVIARG